MLCPLPPLRIDREFCSPSSYQPTARSTKQPSLSPALKDGVDSWRDHASLKKECNCSQHQKRENNRREPISSSLSQIIYKLPAQTSKILHSCVNVHFSLLLRTAFVSLAVTLSFHRTIPTPMGQAH